MAAMVASREYWILLMGGMMGGFGLRLNEAFGLRFWPVGRFDTGLGVSEWMKGLKLGGAYQSALWGEIGQVPKDDDEKKKKKEKP